MRKLEENDQVLLFDEVNERSLVDHLAGYLNDRFDGYAVDVEYNRQRNRAKKYKTVGQPARRIFPDLVVHERGTDNNLLALQCKKSTNPENRAKDKQTLEEMKRDHGYRCAVLVEIQVGEGRAPRDGVDLIWIPE